MTIRIRRAALLDLRSGRDYYDSQLPGLGRRFLASLSADIDTLATVAGVHVVLQGGTYRMNACRFPYAIYYRIADGQVVVPAVLGSRRDPAALRRTLQTRRGRR
jgi:plasmid stabilization system protein ParE